MKVEYDQRALVTPDERSQIGNQHGQIIRAVFAAHPMTPVANNRFIVGYTMPVLEMGMLVAADDVRRPFVILGEAEHLFRAGKLQEGRGMRCHQYLRIVDGSK